MALKNLGHRARSPLPIDVASVPNLDYYNNQNVVINAVDNSIYALTNPVSIGLTRELLATMRPGIVC
jgi:hypothetical protein